MGYGGVSQDYDSGFWVGNFTSINSEFSEIMRYKERFDPYALRRVNVNFCADYTIALPDNYVEAVTREK